MSAHTARHRDEQGAVAVIVSIMAILLFTVTAMAIDLGFARADVRQNQSISDFASLAAADALQDSYVEACRAAVNYVHGNADELSFPPAAGVLSECDAAFATLDASGCTAEAPPEPGATAPVDAVISAGPYNILVRSPVNDDDPAMTLEGQAVTARDGGRCDRVLVTATRGRNYIFGPVIGFFQGNPTADAIAVKTEEDDPDDYASLIVLERHACNALTASGHSGGSGIFVDDGVDDEGNPLPGTIAVDSAGDGGSGPNNCLTGGRYTVNNGSARIKATGSIDLHALALGNAATAHPDPYDSNLLGPVLKPRTNRMTRRPVDWTFNCRDDYSPTHQRYPASGYWDFGPCPDVAEPGNEAYIDELWTALQPAGTPAGFVHVSDCSLPLIEIDGIAAGVPGVHVSCEPQHTMIFENVGHIVFDTKVDSMRLHVDGSGLPGGSVVYFRGPGIRSTSGGPSDPCNLAETGDAYCFQDTFVYIDSVGSGTETHDPSVSLNNASVVWEGMTTAARAACDPMPPIPTAACLAPLSLWSNSAQRHSFGGSGVATLGGSFFTPNATMQLAGGAGFDFTNSQFFSRTINATGGGVIRLVPNPNTNIPTPSFGVGLIR